MEQKKQMLNRQSFIVDLPKKTDKSARNEQRLFCECGHSQNINTKIKRNILRKNENEYEDKYRLQDIFCKSCGKKTDLRNGVITLRKGKSVLGEISFEKKAYVLRGNTIRVLSKSKRFYWFDQDLDKIMSVSIQDLLIYDSKRDRLSLFVKSEKNSPPLTEFSYFNLSDKNFFGSFFMFKENVAYSNVSSCHEFLSEIMNMTYDRDFLGADPFFSNFEISSQIKTEERDGETIFYTLSKHPFVEGEYIKRKLDLGDYLYKLKKMSEIIFIFKMFPPISSLAKLKGLKFVHSAYLDGFFANRECLYGNKATNPHKIVELCADTFLKEPIHNQLNGAEERGKESGFRCFVAGSRFFSSGILKFMKTHQDALVSYKFFKGMTIEKKDIHALFIKYNPDDVIKLMSNIITNPNIRNIKLETKHLNHILKNRLMEDDSSNWLGFYYDTINMIKLIHQIIKEKENKDIKNKKNKKLFRFSDEKLFEINGFEKLKSTHDEMFAMYQALENEEKDDAFRSVARSYKFLNQELDLFRFAVIPNLKELSKEGLLMKHCIYTYLNDIVQGDYIAIRVKDLISGEKATVGIKIIFQKLYLQQIKGYENSRATKELIDCVLNYCQKNNIFVNSEYVHRSDIQPKEELEKRMKNYLDKEKSLIIRRKELDKK